VALPPDLHVHTEWSYDGRRGSMERSCERAIELGLPAIAFTDHADFVKVHEDQYCVDLAGATRAYFGEVLAMLEAGQPFETLAHLDYPKRYWKEGAPPYKEQDFEPEIRAVLKAAARTGRVLEVNTTRGDRLCPDLTVVRWWRELGGQAVQYGSDAHSPDKVAAGFAVATQMVEAAGFKRARDPVSLWRR